MTGFVNVFSEKIIIHTFQQGSKMALGLERQIIHSGVTTKKQRIDQQL